MPLWITIGPQNPSSPTAPCAPRCSMKGTQMSQLSFVQTFIQISPAVPENSSDNNQLFCTQSSDPSCSQILMGNELLVVHHRDQMVHGALYWGLLSELV